ncbi:hypothetical protein EDS67_05145 [candidate division KSB1 bacterium]|nr:MAG: hypothetical protein EDS67_05145 [candidate division KSB1 bacterium]MCE7940748.1 hypothetical protein [Chlorobi bacterium CHB1]MDL1874284.1 hypothetical protein [Cytophagia bacterium CHB2]
MRKIFHLLTIPLILALSLLLLHEPGFSEEKSGKKGQTLAKPTVIDVETVDGNRIFNYLNNRGAWCFHNNPVGFGMQWPGQSGHSIDYASGIWVAGLVNGAIRTACAEFTYEFQPGNINPDGTPDDANSPRHQVLKIQKGDLLDEGFSNPDYTAWVEDLYQLGAPIQRDANGNPILSATGKRIPAIIGDQMLWMVYNDGNPGDHALFGTPPIGLEVQNTIWVFNRPDAFGDMMFVKFLVINKGQNNLENAYVGLWFDIDLGDSNDDLVMCDTTLSLAAFWNDGDDTDYQPPPAIGADFFQGPIVPSPGDTANVSGRKIPDYKNLGMTSFAKYIRGGPPDTQDPELASEAYNFMLGLNGLGVEIIDPTTGRPTKFVNVSDPEAGTGWVDGVELEPADRRMLMNTGPFTLDRWVDTDGDGLAEVGEPGVQEIVAAVLIAQGTNAKNSVTRLKQADVSAQLAYDLNFALPPSPSIPNVTVHNLDREVLLTWDGAVESYEAADRVDVDDEGNPTYYTFQGYNIYQVDAPTVGPGVTVLKLATYDVADGVGDIKDFVFSEEFGETVEATVQRAPDTGLQRYYRITSNALQGGNPLSNWNNYWFVVTAYGYNPHGIPRILESPMTTITVQPKPAAGGLQTKSNFNQMIAAIGPDTTFNATHTTTGSLSDGQLEVYVVDPSQVTGREYRVIFEVVQGRTVWHLERIDPSGPVRVLSNQTNQAGDESYTIADGLLVKAIGPPNDFKRFLCTANGAGPITPPVMGAFAFNSSGFPTSDGLPVEADVNDRPPANQQVGGGRWGIQTGEVGGFDYELFISRTTRDGARWGRIVPYDFEIRFTAAGSVALYPLDFSGLPNHVVIQVPFELWRIGDSRNPDPSDDLRLIPYIIDNNENGVFDLSGTDHTISGGDNDPETDWIYWMLPNNQSPGDAGYQAFVTSVTTNPAGYEFGSDCVEIMARMVLVNFNAGSVSDPTFPANVNQAMPETGTIFQILSTKTNQPVDLYTFNTAGFEAEATAQAAKSAAQLVNIFPNPYLGQNRGEVNPVDRYMTLTHLPDGAVVRIFTLAGDLIQTLDDAARAQQGTLGTGTARWNLRNESDVPVASGMYFIHVDMGALGAKVLKAAVFMPEERLDKF